MKQYNRRKEQMVEVSEPFMNELFSHSCMELQNIFEKIGHQEWDGLEKGLKEVLAIGKRMQEEEDKGKIHYVIFSFLQYAPRGRELGIKIDLLNRNFYLDEQECEGYFYPNILQKKYREDIEVLQKELSRKFIRLQKYEIQQIEVVYAKHYQYICGLMLKSMSEHIMGLLSQSGLSVSGNVVFLYGEYMDKAVVLYQGGR